MLSIECGSAVAVRQFRQSRVMDVRFTLYLSLAKPLLSVLCAGEIAAGEQHQSAAKHGESVSQGSVAH